MKKKSIGAFAVAVVAALGVCMAYAETFVVASGESLTLDAATNNKFDNQITLQDGATLVVPVVDGNDGYRIRANIYVAGAARIEPAATLPSPWYLRICSGLIASNDTCSLTLGGGLTQAFFGRQADDKTPAPDVAVDGFGVHYPIVNIKNVLFDATARGTFVLRSSSACTVVKLPTTCDIKFNDTSVTLALKGEDALAQLGQSNPYAITNFNAVVLDGAAIPGGSTVKVGPGRTLAVKPCTISSTWNWTGTAQEVCFDVELEGEDSMLLFRTKNSGWTSFVGNVAGEGKVYVRGEDNGQSRVMFNGDIACRGGLVTKPGFADVRFGPDAGWRNKVKHWFDAADTNSYVMFTAEPPAGRTHQVGNDTDGHFDTIVGWKDVLHGTNGLFCYNTRMWKDGKQPKQNYVLEVLPYIVPNGLNGLNYISFGLCGGKCTAGWGLNTSSTHARRLPFWKGEADGANLAPGAPASSTCKYAIMVYGSQRGGGMALLGSTDASPSRPNRNNGVDQPWIASQAANFNLVVDGESVNPATVTPNGGWQIVSLDMPKGVETMALGAQKASGESSTAAGGQNYAEVILFDSALTDAERTACEHYLAKKWGLTAAYHGEMTDNTYRLNSSDTNASVAVVGDVTFAGVYEGAVAVDGRSSVSFARQLPTTTEANLPSAGRVGWYDPEFEPTRKMRTTNANRPLELDGVLPRTADGVDTTRGWFGGARGSEDTDRCPWIDEGSRNGGPSRHWINFQDIYLQDNNGNHYGNVLRYKTVPFTEDNVKATSSASFNMQQVFMVLDTSAGGGTPLLDKVGADGIVKARIGQNLPGDDWTKSIHANGGRKTQGVFLGGKAWLNKTKVDPYVHGFTGKPEILTLETTGDFPVGFLGYYGKQDNTKLANFEIMGEVIFYSAPLSDEDRAKVQDYLMYKWLGKVDGAVYSDASAAKLAGGGRVTAAGFDDPAIPALLPSFTGTLAVTNDLAFTVGSPITRSHAVELPQACTITVDVPANTESGTYPLLSASAITGGANATLALPQGAESKYEAQLVLSGNTLSIALKCFKGVTIIVR